MHHFNEQGQFQSDKHPWLPPDTLLISTRRPESRRAVMVWLAMIGRDPDAYVEVKSLPPPRVRLMVDFTDRSSWPIFQALAEDYAEVDAGFSGDVLKRLAQLREAA